MSEIFHQAGVNDNYKTPTSTPYNFHSSELEFRIWTADKFQFSGMTALELKSRSLKMLECLDIDSREARFYHGILYALFEMAGPEEAEGAD